VVAEPPGGGTDPAIAATVRRCADALANAGYEVVDACPPRYADAITIWREFLLGDFEPLLPRLLAIMGEEGRKFLSIGSSVPPLANAAALSALFVQRDGIGRAWSQFLAQTPLLLSPTWTQHPFAVGHDIASPEARDEVMESVRPVVPANLLGLPSACVPAGRDAATGVPTGVLLTGAPFREDLCLAAAEVVEARLGLKTPIDPTA
jgi:amidase